MSSKQQTLLGLLAVAALAVLGFYTLFLADVNLFGRSIQLVAQFPGAQGLREGDPVLVAGLLVGRVKALSFDATAPEDQRITVVLNLDQEVPLFEDYAITIEESTLLGGRNVSILPGAAALPRLELAGGMVLTGTVGATPMDSIESIAELVDESRAAVSRILGNLEKTTDDIARRFINMVDEFYDRNVKLIISAEVELKDLYTGGRLNFEFQRTLSRLLEMQSHEFLSRAHKP